MSTELKRYTLSEALEAKDELVDNIANLLGVVVVDMKDEFDDTTLDEALFWVRRTENTNLGSHKVTLYGRRFAQMLVEHILYNDSLVFHPAGSELDIELKE